MTRGTERREVLYDERYQRQSKKVNCTHLNAGFRVVRPCCPPPNVLSHGGHTESLWGRNCERRGLALVVPPSVVMFPQWGTTDAEFKKWPASTKRSFLSEWSRSE